MTAQPVDWVLVVFYGPAAHQATYGRQVRDGGYTKDYIQLSQKKAFLEAVETAFSVTGASSGPLPLTFRWPKGSTPGAFVFQSADRPHLKWETSKGAPAAWKMTPLPNDSTQETIPGDPSHADFDSAENEFAQIVSRGAGQPYLMAIKLRDEPRTLHLRVYLADPSANFSWADLKLTPKEVQALAAKTSQRSALAWSLFQSGGVFATETIKKMLSGALSAADIRSKVEELEHESGRELISYLRNPGRGLFFDPNLNHDAWSSSTPLETHELAATDELLQILESRFPATHQDDAAAEAADVDPDEVDKFRKQVSQSSYAVPDSTATTKTRGSAQRAFAEAVKGNYGNRCAVSGIETRDFLIASHIVPWSKDQSIRLDPSNGICLSLLVDRAFEKGYLRIEDDFTIRLDLTRIGNDLTLLGLLKPYEGTSLRLPKSQPPQPAYLRRRRELVDSTSS